MNSFASFALRRQVSTDASSRKALLQTLGNVNLGILQQKLALLQGLQQHVGPRQAQSLFSKTCPIVRATAGQHIRHSMDHMDLALSKAAATIVSDDLHYDLRRRGGTDEHDLEAAKHRIETAMDLIQSSQILQSPERLESDVDETINLRAHFQLAGGQGSTEEFPLPTTLERELGFVVHHAIHHLAMVQIIARETWKLPENLMPDNFGKAPSTVLFDNGIDTKSAA